MAKSYNHIYSINDLITINNNDYSVAKLLFSEKLVNRMSNIYIAYDKSNNRNIIIKQSAISTWSIMNEVIIYKYMTNSDLKDHIPKYIDNDDDFMIIEYLDGISLEEVIKSHHIFKFSWNDYCTLVFRLFKIFYKLINNSICHIDIKLSNIILYKNDIYLIDFGLSYIYNSSTSYHDINYNLRGSLGYILPFKCHTKYYGHLQDYFCIICMLYPIFCGKFSELINIQIEQLKSKKNIQIYEYNDFIKFLIRSYNNIFYVKNMRHTSEMALDLGYAIIRFLLYNYKKVIENISKIIDENNDYNYIENNIYTLICENISNIINILQDITSNNLENANLFLNEYNPNKYININTNDIYNKILIAS